MRASFLKTLLLASAALAVPAAAQPTPDAAASVQRLETDLAPAVIVKGREGTHTTLASRMAALHVPGVSITVIHDGEIAWARGFGVSRIGGAPITPETLFQAGSISKPVAAMALLHLAQTGTLDLDADVNRYLKSWKVPQNEFTAKKAVTLRELITHTAGMTVHGFPGYAQGEKVPSLVQVLDGAKPANTPPIRVDTVPGTAWRYSGGGITVMQQALMDVTGKPFPQLMQETVLGPLGMTHSTYAQPLPAARMAQAATPYNDDGAPIKGGAHTYPEMAAAGLWTTPSDLARYAIAVQEQLAGTSNPVLSMAMTQQMLKPGGLGSWGLGLELGGKPEHPHFGHGGVDEGFVALLLAYNKGDGVAVMTNGDNGGRLADEIQRTIARDYHWPDFAPKEIAAVALDPKLLDGYAGYYRQGRYLVMHVVRSDDHLVAAQGGMELGSLYPNSPGNWFSTGIPVQVTFGLDDKGRATSFAFQTGPAVPAPRISAADATRIAGELAAKLQNKNRDPAGEALLRRNIEGLRSGKPDYASLGPGLAAVTKQQLSQLTATITGLGALKSVTFKDVGERGDDVYEITFEKGRTEWHILVGADGKAESIGFQTL